jgi:hypothetical protein
VPIKLPDPGPALTFTVDAGSDAARVSATLTALGYDVRRVVPASQWCDLDARDQAVQRLAIQCGLVTREITYVWGVLNELGLDEAIAAQGSAQTLKWIRRATLVKCVCEDEAELRAKVESLQDLRGSDEAKAAQSDEIVRLRREIVDGRSATWEAARAMCARRGWDFDELYPGEQDSTG